MCVVSPRSRRNVHSASAHTRAGSPTSKNSTWITLGLQQIGQSSTYRCSLPLEGSSGMMIDSPQVGQTYRPSSRERRRFPLRFFTRSDIQHFGRSKEAARWQMESERRVSANRSAVVARYLRVYAAYFVRPTCCTKCWVQHFRGSSFVGSAKGRLPTVLLSKESVASYGENAVLSILYKREDCEHDRSQCIGGATAAWWQRLLRFP
jgi:hypothetical protein